MSETLDRRNGDDQILVAIGALRTEVSERLDQQDTALSELKAEMGEMKKVLPMKFFKALEGTSQMASMLGKFSGTVAKIGAACIVTWALFKFVVLEAIRQVPK